MSKPTKKQIKAWKHARVMNYLYTRSALSLAEMLVDLEDKGEHAPEFGIDDEWPAKVAGMKVHRMPREAAS